MLNVALGHILVRSCSIRITIRAKQRGQFLKKRLFARNDVVIPPYSETMVPLLLVPLSNDRDFLFYPTAQPNLTLFAHIIHYNTSKVLVRNTSNCPLRILHRQKLRHVVDIWYNNCFLIDIDSTFNAITVPPQAALFFKHELSWVPTPINSSMKTTLDNGVRVYRDEHVVTLLSQLMAKYPSIWESDGFV